jgi:phenylacetate-CoA ligase
MRIPPFERFPRPIRQTAISVIGWRNRMRRFGREYQQWQILLRQSEDWSVTQRDAWQQDRLGALVRSARSGTRYYSESLPAAENIEAASSLREALDLIPVLDKSTLRTRPMDFRNSSVAEVVVTSTSGSTGSPMKVGHCAQSIQRGFAFLSDQLRIAGIDPKAPSVRLSGRILCEVGIPQSQPWLFNAAENQLFLSSYHLDDVHGPIIAARLCKLRPVLLDGYPSGVLETLRLLHRQGHKLDSLKAIITTAETLSPETREELSALSGVPIMDYYAASEGVPLIQQCPYGTYHVRWQSGIFEIDDGTTIGFEGDGELICTSFIQDRTPLIRYRTGDLVKGLRLQTSRCECGLLTPTVESVQGRVEDLVYTPDGRALGMFTYRTLKFIDGLGETQVIQNDYWNFEVNSTVSSAHSSQVLADEVKKSFERALGYPITLQFNRVEQLPRGANGKVRLVISKVAKRGALLS